MFVPHFLVASSCCFTSPSIAWRETHLGVVVDRVFRVLSSRSSCGSPPPLAALHRVEAGSLYRVQPRSLYRVLLVLYSLTSVVFGDLHLNLHHRPASCVISLFVSLSWSELILLFSLAWKRSTLNFGITNCGVQILEFREFEGLPARVL